MRLWKLGLLALTLMLTTATSFADTVEERLARLESDVAQLKQQVLSGYGTVAYLRRGTYLYRGGNDCTTIKKSSTYYRYDVEMRIVKRIACPQGIYVIAVHRIPAGYQGAGNQSVDTFAESDLVIPGK